jgi:hypothetical protein
MPFFDIISSILIIGIFIITKDIESMVVITLFFIFGKLCEICAEIKKKKDND